VYLVPAHISSVLSALSYSRLADIHWLIAVMHCSSVFTDDDTLLRSQEADKNSPTVSCATIPL